MNVSGQQLSTQTLKLPIPRLPNTKLSEMLNNWPNTSSQFPVTQPVITCQPITGKPSQSKRGRKPLSRMPETKKHIQNLTNQRAFRRRREDYVRSLEAKATNYESLYSQAQSEIKMLRDKLALLERRLAKAQGNNNKCGNNTTIYRSIEENDTSAEVSINSTYDDTPNTMTPFSFNDRYKSSSPSSESIEDIINNPVFCETKDGDLCFCESVDDIEKVSQLSSVGGRYRIDQREGKRMHIIPKQSIVNPNPTIPFSNINACCPALPSLEQSQWRQESYYTPSPSPSPVESSTSNFTNHHPLNLKLILGGNESDESDD